MTYEESLKTKLRMCDICRNEAKPTKAACHNCSERPAIEALEKQIRYEKQYLDDMSNPLEPLKLVSALESEIWKLEYRIENKPKDVSPLDYTIIYALKKCLDDASA